MHGSAKTPAPADKTPTETAEEDAVHLHELMRGLAADLPAENPEIRGLVQDSRRVSPGDLYVAIAGTRFDGRRFAAEAARRGAVAVLGPAPEVSSSQDAAPLPWVTVDDPRPLLGRLTARLNGPVHDRLLLAGVTGTNGKSTVARLLAAILDAAGHPAGLCGTLGYRFGGRDFLDGEAARRTTPEATDLQRLLHAMADAGARAAALEISSHGLELGRVTGLELGLGVFTNLSRDHLDFHGDLESYFAAKRRLFDHLAPDGRAVVTVGDAWGERLAEELRPRLGARLTTCAETAGDVHAPDVYVADAHLDAAGITAILVTPTGELELRSPLLGRLNLKNLVTAAAGALALDLPATAIVEGVDATRPLPGRLEPIDAGQPFPVLVDFAHTPAALEAALRSLHELASADRDTPRRIAVVFGCGGDRDRGKRATMGRLAAELSDLAVVTSDNPRGEDPEAILDAVEVGLRESGSGRWLRLADRRAAIRAAIAEAAADPEAWAVLVAGKGHEAEQIIGDVARPFSDAEELRQALAGHGFRKMSGPGQEAHQG